MTTKISNIAIIDKTGRGHAICNSLVSNQPDLYVYYIPGTGGFFDDRIEVVNHILIEDGMAISRFCKEKGVDLVFVSHIDALNNGVADTLREQGLLVCGPSLAAVQLESSKWYCKEICQEAKIPTPFSQIFESEEAFISFLEKRGASQYFVKADWLTQNGNGAFAVNPDEGIKSILEKIGMLTNQNSSGCFRFLVEEYQSGVDFSAHFILNSKSIVDLPSSMDYKKRLDFDKGVNCDGMGSISPHPLENSFIQKQIKRKILFPLLGELKKQNISYNGPIYLGLRIDKSGNPFLIEINTRMGDSESEVIFPRIGTDLSVLLYKLASEVEVKNNIAVNKQKSLSISLVTSIVPTSSCNVTSYSMCWPNSNLPTNEVVSYNPEYLVENAQVFWANIEHGSHLTRVGRIAHISALGETLESAKAAAYASVSTVDFPSKQFRSDIGTLHFISNKVAQLYSK